MSKFTLLSEQHHAHYKMASGLLIALPGIFKLTSEPQKDRLIHFSRNESPQRPSKSL